MTPAGTPLRLNVTGLLNPFSCAIFADAHVYWPRPIVRLLGDMLSENVGACTWALIPDVAEAAPAVFVAVTVTSMYWPASADWSVYVAAVAPEIGVQLEELVLLQRLHW